MECVVVALVCLAPWAFGAVHPAFEGLLYAGVGLLLILWAVRVILDRTFVLRRCPVLIGLAGLFLFGVVQLVPLPHALLTRLSPKTTRLCADLIPAEREQLEAPGTIPAVSLPAGERLSLYPAGTRQELIRLLAVLLLFAAVRYNVASPEALYRLAIAATVNGAALGLFAFLQFFSSPSHLVYWTLQARGDTAPFGPFLCRNHFPYYVNLCIGLAVGLLLTRQHRGTQENESPQSRRWSWWDLFDLLHDPVALWVSAGLAMMLAAVAFSLSRGGLIGLAAGGAVTLLLRAARSSSPGRWGGTLLAVGLALGLLTWLGIGPLRTRLSTLWEGDALQDGRRDLWADVLPAAKDFPLAGTGYGSFQYVEPVYRTTPALKEFVVEHAHNDYLEALVEGGIIRLVLSLAVIFFVYRLGWRALRRFRGQSTAGLVLGALFGFTAVAVHSFVDFGLHVPAIMALTAVVAAHIAGLGEKRNAPASVPVERSWSDRLTTLGIAVSVPMLALVLGVEGWRMAWTESLRLGSKRLGGDAGVELIEAATKVSPERADLHLESAQAYVTRYETASIPDDGTDRAKRTAREHLLPALSHYVQARDLCPLSARANLRLAVHRDLFARADSRATYLERARRLLASDPEVHYLAGCLELADGDRQGAMASWRQSLELAETFQSAIVERASGILTDEDLLDRILPDRPQQIFAAAAQLDAQRGAARCRPFHEKALRLLSAPGIVHSASDLHLKALLHKALGEPDEACDAYKAALDRSPKETEWRIEYARLLQGQGRPAEALRQVEVILIDEPEHREGNQLLRALAHDRAKKK
jgi:O-antigen ligase/tetratricopeptide (TPR) repeat protein